MIAIFENIEREFGVKKRAIDNPVAKKVNSNKNNLFQPFSF